MDKIDIDEKFANLAKTTNFANLNTKNQQFLKELYYNFRFSFSEFSLLVDYGIDLHMWKEGDLQDLFKSDFKSRKQAYESARFEYEKIKTKAKNYDNFTKEKQELKQYHLYNFSSEKLALGLCPVASEGTRCCNLYTLDAVNSCGFDCSYCSIQSFYKQEKIGFNENFVKNLQNLKLDKNKTYHIGTGQSSDSLMWGNKNGILDALCEFALRHENVILEFKTKSNNISYLLKNDIPKNILVTWSLNPQIIIDNEEHLTADLSARLKAAKMLENKGILVGFHFHPMVIFEDYQKQYGEIFAKLISEFDPKNVATISFGTLTFINKVISTIRKRKFYSKILQMPMQTSNKKLSYPLDMKKELFCFAYSSFKPWHDRVFFYMCMEDKSLWKDVFGYEYTSNDEFEKAMKKSYFAKIRSRI